MAMSFVFINSFSNVLNK